MWLYFHRLLSHLFIIKEMPGDLFSLIKASLINWQILLCVQHSDIIHY